MVAATERAIVEWLESLGIDEPQERAHRHIRWLQARGWRVHPALVDGPPPRRVAPSEVAREALAGARQVLDAKRGRRPELEDGAS